MKGLRFIGSSIFIVLMSIDFAACSSDSDEDSTPKVLIEDFDQGNITFTEQSNVQSFTFTANSSWTITVSSNGGDTSWCTVYPSSGEKGTQTVSVSTEANTSYDDRNATITLTSGTQTKSFVVTQKQKDALLLTSDKFEVDKAGGTITVEVKSNVSYTATIGDECKDWIKESNGTRALTTTTKVYTISPSEETEKREGTITFTDGTLSEVVHVYQTGGYSVVLNQRSYVIDEKGGAVTVELRSNCDYDVIMPDVDWIKEDKTRAMSSHTLYYLVAENTTYDSREAIIIYKDKKDLVRDTLTITQAQLNAVVLVDKKLSIGSVGGTIEAKVKSNVSYEVVMPDADWVSYVPKSRGLTESVEQFTVKENSSHDDRSAKVVFKTSDGKKDTLVIAQSQFDAIILTNKNVAVESKGETIDVKVMSNVEYKVEIPSDVDWITLVPQSRGLSESTVQLAISENKTYDNRSANIIFKSGDNVKDTLSITQAQKNALIISDKNVSVESGGGTIDVKVKSNVDYEVEIPSDISWIKVAPQSRALTESTVQLLVDENSEYDNRSAKIYFKSKGGLRDTLSITQSQKDALILSDREVSVESEGGTIDIKVKSNITYDVEIPSETSWITIAPKSRGLSESTVQLIVSENKTYDNRSSKIIFKANDGVKDTLSITQAQKNALIISNKNVSVEYGGGTISVKVQSNVDYDVEIPSSASWITMVPQSRALTESTVQFSVSENSGYENRSAEIIFKSSTGIKDTLNVTQTVNITTITVKTLGTFEQLYSSYDYPQKIKVIGPVYASELNSSLCNECRYCDLSEVIIYDNEGNKWEAMNHIIDNYASDYISTLILPNHITSITDKAFANRTYLKHIVFPNTLISIGDEAFYGCTNLSNFSLPNSVTTIGNSAFSFCESLTNISIPNSVTTIGGGAFYRCNKMTSATLSENIHEIPASLFEAADIRKIIIPDKVTTIEQCAFWFCDNLTDITFSKNLTKIGDGAFNYCYSLSKISIPSSVTTIGYMAFRFCKIEDLIIPCNVKEIGHYAFTSIKNCYIYAKTPPTIEQTPFVAKNFSESALYVPKGCTDAYKDWGSMFYNIYEMDE